LTIEESSIGKFTFQIKENSSNKMMTLAAKNFITYEKWIRLLSKGKSLSQSPQSKSLKSQVVEETLGEQLDDVSVASTDFKPLKVDIIADHFFQPELTEVVEVVSIISFSIHLNLWLLVGHHESSSISRSIRDSPSSIGPNHQRISPDNFTF